MSGPRPAEISVIGHWCRSHRQAFITTVRVMAVLHPKQVEGLVDRCPGDMPQLFSSEEAMLTICGRAAEANQAPVYIEGRRRWLYTVNGLDDACDKAATLASHLGLKEDYRVEAAEPRPDPIGGAPEDNPF